MPRGVPKKKTRKPKRTFGGIKQVFPESDFLTAGSTHTREKLSKVSALESDYSDLLDQADELATFIENVPRDVAFPENVVAAYKAIKHRKLTYR